MLGPPDPSRAKLLNNEVILFIAKKVCDVRRHHRADILNLQQGLLIRLHKIFEAAKVAGQGQRRRLANFTNSESKQQTRQSGLT